MRNLPAPHRFQAFSLVELLVVMALIAILSALAVPAFSSIAQSGRVSQALAAALSTFSLAAQRASSEDRPVTVRLLKGADGNYAALQLVEIMPDGTARALDRVVKLPEGVAFASSTNLSSFFSLPERAAGAGDPPVSGLPAGYSYRQFQFRPDGRLGLSVTNAWFLTVLLSRGGSDSSTPPANFATVQVDPVNGRLSVYRP
jgi:uncharacterized protein (TIGR02596 family)